MVKSHHQFVLICLGAEEEAIFQHPLEVNWSPAFECVRWKGLREGILGPQDIGGTPEITPLRVEDTGLPYTSGFRMTLRTHRNEALYVDFTNEYFADAATLASSTLSERDQERVAAYCIAAFPRREEANPSQESRFRVHAEPMPFRVHEGELDRLLRASEQHGQHEGNDAQVFIPNLLLDETAAVTIQNGEQETGGILLGKVFRDGPKGDLFLVVTGQIPAEHTQSTSTKLTFTPQTWAAAHSALVLRNQGEIMLGWWHSHLPRYWCSDCPPEKKAHCHLTNGFLSITDRRLHEAVFPCAHNLALVETYGETVDHALFSWRQGQVLGRGFRIFEGTDHDCTGSNVQNAQIEGTSQNACTQT